MMVSCQNRSLLLLVLSAHNSGRSHRRRFTSADLLPLLADEPDTVKNVVFPSVAVRRESSVTEVLGGSGVLRFKTKQQQEGRQQQEQQHSGPVAVGSVSGSNGPGEVLAVMTNSGRESIRRVFFQQIMHHSIRLIRVHQNIALYGLDWLMDRVRVGVGMTMNMSSNREIQQQ